MSNDESRSSVYHASLADGGAGCSDRRLVKTNEFCQPSPDMNATSRTSRRALASVQELVGELCALCVVPLRGKGSRKHQLTHTQH